MSNSGALALCLTTCNPLGDDCGAGQGCYPAGSGFICAPDASGSSGAPGDPCENINACDPGLICSGADFVPGCTGAVGCCAQTCDLAAPECPADQSCQALYEEGESPDACLATIGLCQ